MSDDKSTGATAPAETPASAGNVPAASAAVEQATVPQVARLNVRVEPQWDASERLQAARQGHALPEEICVAVDLSLDHLALDGLGKDGGAKIATYRKVPYEALGDLVRYAWGECHLLDAVEGAARVSALQGADPQAAAEEVVRRWTVGYVQVQMAKEEREANEKRAQAEAEEWFRAEAAKLPDEVKASLYGTEGNRRIYCSGDYYASADDLLTTLAEKREKTAKREAAEKSRAEWIEAHGSEGLKERVKRGYDCARRYITERLAEDLPGWVASKWDDLTDWELKGRSCPNDSALKAEDEAKAAGYEARTYWAVWECPKDCNPYMEHEEGREDSPHDEAEVVVVENFHGYEVYKRL